MQAPNQDVYICASCAQIASAEFDKYERGKAAARSSLIVGVIVCAFAGWNWFALDDEAAIGRIGTGFAFFLGLGLIGSFLLQWNSRRRRRS
jgi:hypothetical protein